MFFFGEQVQALLISGEYAAAAAVCEASFVLPSQIPDIARNSSSARGPSEVKLKGTYTSSLRAHTLVVDAAFSS